MTSAPEQPKLKPNVSTRRRPKIIEAPTASTEEQPGKPPADAVILFDGKSLGE